MLITHVILVITILVSYFAFNDKFLFHRLAYSPYQVKHQKQWYRSFTHAFIHADLAHLILNMFVLYTFGEVLERSMSHHFGVAGKVYFTSLYLGGILFATLLSYSRHQNNSSYLSVGASGAVSAVIFASIIMIPQMKLSPIFIPFPIPGFIFGFLYLTAEIIMDKRARNNIAHDAHLMGALFGIFFICTLDFSLLKGFMDFVKNYFL